MKDITEILEKAREQGASDIHVAPGTRILLRTDGTLVPLTEDIVKPFEIEEMIRPMLTDRQMEMLEKQGELDFAYSIPGFHRLRVNVFRQRGTYAMSLRLLAIDIPTPKELGLPQAVVNLTTKKRGLILVTGADGSGKSTTLAAMLGVIAENYTKTVITLEDPIEYLYQHQHSMVLQREIGSDSQSYASGLASALRQDPDVIMVGELQDMETISLALTAAETGHLVLSTLHTDSVSAAIDRMIEVFPPHHQQQVRVQLASTIVGVIAQQLLPKQDLGGQKQSGRVAAFEVLLANETVCNQIREGRTYQLQKLLQMYNKDGMQSMDDAIYDLYMKSAISSETAILYANDSIGMKQKVQLF